MDDIRWKMDDDLSFPMGEFIKPGARRPQAGVPGFLKIDAVRIVGMRVRVRVCPRPRLLITWRDMNLIRLVKQALQLLYGNYSRYH